MALLKFLKGNYSSLNNRAIAEGQVLICGDTGEMFVDIASDKRIKIGDFVVVPTIEALEALSAATVPTSRLYYVENGNILARSNGTNWIQINKQKTLAELGGVAKSVYDAKMTALEQADTNNSNAISSLGTLVGSIPEGATATTVIGYIDEKTAGIASNAALQGLTDRVTAAESDIDALQNTLESAVEAATADLDYTATGMGKGKTIKNLTQVDGKIAVEFEDIEVAQSQVTGLSTALTDVNAAIGAEKTRAEGIESGLRTDVDAIKADYLKSTDKTALQSAIDTEKGRLDTFLAAANVGDAAVDTLKEIQDYINTHGEAAATLTTKVGALETTVGKAADGENPATGLVKAVADNAAQITVNKNDIAALLEQITMGSF